MLQAENSLFAGSEGGARRRAIGASLIETAKLNGVEPYNRTRETLTCVVEGHHNHQPDEVILCVQQH